jgi:hypothetical protein
MKTTLLLLALLCVLAGCSSANMRTWRVCTSDVTPWRDHLVNETSLDDGTSAFVNCPR